MSNNVTNNKIFLSNINNKAVVDPGFPVGGVDPLGGMDLQCWCFLVKIYAKMKELGPIGGCAPGMPLRSANAKEC